LLAYDGGAPTAALLAMVSIGAIGAFLVANLPRLSGRAMRCFLGDSGSTLLGFTVVVAGILATQGDGRTTAPVTVLWLAALPLYDIIWAIARRLFRRQSPLQPDEEHVHHLLLRAGLPARSALGVLITLAVALAAIGVALERAEVPESYSFGLFAITGVLIVRILCRLRVYLPA